MATARVLLVDDEDLVLRAVTAMLCSGGFEVVQAAKPDRALEILGSLQIDLILTDITMPEMRGTELARQAGFLQPDTPIVLMTGGFIDPADLPEGVTLLLKPFLVGDLLGAVEAALARGAELPARPALSIHRPRNGSAEGLKLDVRQVTTA